MKKKIYIYIAILLIVGVTSCDNETPLDKEQYTKQIYLVGAVDNVVTRQVPYSSQEQEVFVSVAMGGSRLSDKDVTVNLSNHNTVIEWYNKKFKYLQDDIRYQLLEPSYFSIPSFSTAIKAGESYSRVPVKIATKDLHCDSLYAVTFDIESVSDYEVNRVDSALILSFEFTNNYSGIYLLEATRYAVAGDGSTSNPTAMSVMRTMKAVNANTVRFFNEQKAEIVTNITTSCITFTFDENNDVLVGAWDDFPFEEGVCTYAKDKDKFNFDYKYILDGRMYQMVGALTRQIEK